MDDQEDQEEEANPNALIGYKGGVWEILSTWRHPDEDLRPQWGYAEDEHPRSTYKIRHRFGPKHPEGIVYVSDAYASDFTFPNELEILAMAALD